MMTKNRFIKKVKKNGGLSLLTFDDLKYAVCKDSIGADGFSIAFSIIWLRDKKKKSHSSRNKKSLSKMIRWLKSEMRSYMDFGSWDPFVGDVCKRIYTLMYEKAIREKEVNENEKFRDS